MHTFFTAISQALTDSNKRINIDVSGLEGGRVKVVLSANIGPTPCKGFRSRDQTARSHRQADDAVGHPGRSGNRAVRACP